MINNMLDNDKCLIIKLATLVLGIVIFYKSYNFVILSGLLLFVFGVDDEVAFCRLCHNSLFYFRQINVLIILNLDLLKHRQNIYMSSLEVSKLSFVKAQLYGLRFANATFYLSSFKLLVLFTFTWLLSTSLTFYFTASSFRHQ